jgi:DNA-directed RNA polymerase subunit M/transcription elongation factor TFIIS
MEKLLQVWKCLRPNTPYPEVSDEMMYELLFRPNCTSKQVWDLSTFNQLKREDAEFNKYIITPIEVVDGILQCTKCKSHKILSFSKQTRSGDEPTSVFAKCSNCQHKWVQ